MYWFRYEMVDLKYYHPPNTSINQLETYPFKSSEVNKLCNKISNHDEKTHKYFTKPWRNYLKFTCCQPYTLFSRVFHTTYTTSSSILHVLHTKTSIKQIIYLVFELQSIFICTKNKEARKSVIICLKDFQFHLIQISYTLSNTTEHYWIISTD